MNITKEQKKKETRVLVILGLILAIIWLVSKFVLGVNFSLMEHGSYVAFGYHEIRDEEIWALSFDSFSGTISTEAKFPENGKHRLLVHSGKRDSGLELAVRYGEENLSYLLTGNTLDLTLPEDTEKFTMTLSGTEVQSGYFSAIWE